MTRISKKYQQRKSDIINTNTENEQGLDLLEQMEQLELKLDDPFAMLRENSSKHDIQNQDQQEPKQQSIDLETQIMQAEAKNQGVMKKRFNRLAEDSVS